MASSGKASTTVERQETLVIENRLSELSRVEQWLAGLADQWTLSPRVAFGVDLVINEALANVISYAYSDSAVHAITISLTNTAESVAVEVVDDGEAFDPFKAPAIAPSRELEDADIGGRGIHLIKSYTDGHHYSRVANHNRLILRIDKCR